MADKGFTLVELLVAITVTVILGLVMTSVLLQSLRGEKKANLISQIKQSGQFTLDKMANEIRQADKILCPDSPAAGSRLVILVDGHKYIRYGYYVNPVTGYNAYLARDDITSSWLDCPAALSGALDQSTAQILTNQDGVNGINIDEDKGYITGQDHEIFTVDKKEGYPDAVTIRYRAFGGVKSGQTYETSIPDGVLLMTTVKVRNI